MNWIKKLWSKKGEGTAQQDIGGALAPAYGQDLQSPDELMNRANKRAVKGDVEGAIADFDAAIDLNPAKATAFYNRGYLHNLAGNHQQAIADCSDAIALLPDYDEAFYQRGIAHQELGNIDAAIVDLSEVLRLNPFSIKAYYKRANCYAINNDVQGAVADYTQAILRVPKDANAYLQRGLFLTKMQEYRTAVEDFSSALSFNPKNADAYYHRGYCYAELGEKEKATQDFNQAMLYDPNQRAADYNRNYALGILKTSKNLPPASSPPIAESSGQDDTVWVQDEEAVVLSLDPTTDNPGLDVSIDDTELVSSDEMLGSQIPGIHKPSAPEMLTSPMESGLDNTELIPTETPLAPPTPSPASVSNESSVSSVPAQVNIDRLFELAEHQVESGQVDAAIEVYSQIIECQPENHQAYLERGKNLRSMGKPEAAAADMRAAVYWAKHKSLDLMKDYSGSISETLSDLKQSIARAKAQPESSSAIVPGHVNQSIEGAILKHSQAIHRNPLDAQAYFERAKSRALLGDLEGAIADYTRTITLDENFRDAYYKRGLLLGSLGDVEGATQDMNRAIRRKPTLPASQPSASAVPIEAQATVMSDEPLVSEPQAESSDALNSIDRSLPNEEFSSVVENPLSQELVNDTPVAQSELDALLNSSVENTSQIDQNIAELLDDDSADAQSELDLEAPSTHLESTSVQDSNLEQLLHSEDIHEDSGAEQDSELEKLLHDEDSFDESSLVSPDMATENSHEQLDTPDETLDDDLLDATLILNRPSASLVQKSPGAADSPPAKVWQEDQTLLLNNTNQTSEEASASTLPKNFNAFSRQTWMESEGNGEGELPTYFSDLVLEPCNHEGNSPENRFCIHCGQAISPTL